MTHKKNASPCNAAHIRGAKKQEKRALTDFHRGALKVARSRSKTHPSAPGVGTQLTDGANVCFFDKEVQAGWRVHYADGTGTVLPWDVLRAAGEELFVKESDGSFKCGHRPAFCYSNRSSYRALCSLNL